MKLFLDGTGLPTNITTKTNTSISDVHILRRIVINKVGSADTIAIYDGTDASGHLIATLTSPVSGGQYEYNAQLRLGALFIVTGGTTAGDYTVIAE